MILFLVFVLSSASAESLSLDSSRWTVLSFNKISPNSVEFKNNQIQVNVNRSAGPLVFKLPSVIRVTRIHVEGELSGEKRLEQGEFDEDSVLRVGLVATGEQKLSSFKKLFAASWVKRLFELAPPGIGLDKIYFYEATNRKELLGRSRQHPKSNLINEQITTWVDHPGPFVVEETLPSPISTAAIWLSIDGDDTASAFVTTIKKIVLSPE